MNIQTFDPSTIVFNPTISARKGEPDPAKVDKLANNFVERREAGRAHQICPGIVRITESKKGKELVEVIAGRNRLAACVKLNSMLPEGGEPFLFSAIAVPSTDEQALLDAIDENEFRTATNALDKAAAIQRLLDRGNSQSKIAQHLQLSESLVSEILRCSKLPKGIQTKYEKGEITEGGIILLARYNKDKDLQTELLSIAEQEREARERAEQRAEGKDVAPAATKGSKSEPTAPASDAVKSKKRGGKATPTGRTTAGDVKKAVKKKGAAKRKSDGPEKKTRAEFVTFLGWLVPDEHDLGEPVGDLAGKLESWFDGDASDQQLKNQIVKSCRSKY